MRLLGTLTPKAADRFAHALRTRGLAASLRPEADGTVGIWIHNEDQLASARNELDAFERDPQSSRFDPPASPPVPEKPPDSPPRQRPAGLAQAWRRSPVTATLIAASVVSCLFMWFGGDFGERLQGDLAIAPVEIRGERGSWIPQEGLNAVLHGQVWRLVTPIFPHGGPLHLLFNMSWLWLLGGVIETVRGSWRLAVLVLVSAVASNLAEFYFDFGFGFDLENGLKSRVGFDPDPMFLGMSGVVFALFGFVWIRSRLIPRSGFLMPRDMVVWMLIWLLVCTSGLVGPIANVAHGVGLLTGMIFGAAPRLWVKRSPQ